MSIESSDSSTFARVSSRAGNPPDTPDPTLILFCRKPQTGVGKRRIARDLGDRQTAEIAHLLLECAIEDAVQWDGPVIIAPATPEDSEWAAELLPGRAAVMPQPSGNLGERITAIDTAARANGHSQLIFIGSDAPVLTPAYYLQARMALDDADIVLGPADDGGVTLMGATRPWPNLTALPWSTAALGAELEQACETAGMSLGHLETQYDVDQLADLQRLHADLEGDHRPARQALHKWLKDNPATDESAETATRISLVIPVLGDHAELSGLLERVRDMSAQPYETIVVDGGNDHRVASLCDRHGCTYLNTRKGRGQQLHTGAMRASGDVIWFLHADSQPAAQAIEAIREGIDAGLVGGYFRFRFAGQPAAHKSLLAYLINLRCHFGIPYGDQGLFIRRPTYIDNGGFDDVPLFEEVRFIRAARAAGRFESLSVSLGVSTRRWDRDGWLRRTLQNRMLAAGHRLGISPARLARFYGRSRTQQTDAPPSDKDANTC